MEERMVTIKASDLVTAGLAVGLGVTLGKFAGENLNKCLMEITKGFLKKKDIKED